MGKVSLAQVKPEPLDRVELRRVGRQRHQGEIVGDDQGAGAMPARLVEHEHGMSVRGNLGRQLGQKPAHRGGRDGRQHERHFGSGSGLDGGEEVSRGKALVAQARRALAPDPPTVSGAAFLAHSGLVFEPQLDALTRVGLLGCCYGLGEAPFLKASCAWALACG